MMTFGELHDILGSHIKVNEFLLALHGVKPVSRLLIDKARQEKLSHAARVSNIPIIFSSFSLALTEDETLGYSNKGSVADDGDALIAYLGHGDIEEARSAEHDGDHLRLGKALGYPVCCCEFFVKHFAEQSIKNNDYVLPMLAGHHNLETIPYPWYNNVFMRYGDFALLSHFPCTVRCKESEKLARHYLDLIDRLRAKYGTAARNLMSYSVLYTEDTGVFFFRDAIKEGELVRFSSVMGTMRNDLFGELEQEKRFLLSDRAMTIGDKSIEAFFVRFQ